MVASPKAFAFGLKKLMVDWGWEKSVLYVDRATSTLYIGSDKVASAKVAGTVSEVDIANGWKDALQDPKLDEIIHTAQDRLTKKSQVKGNWKRRRRVSGKISALSYGQLRSSGEGCNNHDEFTEITFNVFTKTVHIRSNDKQSQMISELENMSWDVICMSETKAKSDDVDLFGGYRLITSLGDQKYVVGWQFYSINASLTASRTFGATEGEILL